MARARENAAIAVFCGWLFCHPEEHQGGQTLCLRWPKSRFLPEVTELVDYAVYMAPRHPRTHQHLARLKILADAERDAEVRLQEAKDQLDLAVRSARGDGVEWQAIEAATLFSTNALIWRVKGRDYPSVEELRQRRAVGERKSREGELKRTRGPGVSISDFARQEGVSRKTVYNWIDAGKLLVEKNEFGHQRITGHR